MSNNRLEVPYSIRMQQTKDRLRAKRAQMEKNVHIRSKEEKRVQEDKGIENSPQNKMLNSEKSTVNKNVSAKKMSNKSKEDTMLKDEKRIHLQQMIVMSEILSKPVSMRKRHYKRGNS